jgi:hypothetical protein
VRKVLLTQYPVSSRVLEGGAYPKRLREEQRRLARGNLEKSLLVIEERDVDRSFKT